MNSPPELVVGLGSQFGDDRAGWNVARRIAADCGGEPRAVICRQPLEMLEWLPGHRCVWLVDACRSGAPAGTIIRLKWPSQRLPLVRGASTHGIDVEQALGLMAALGNLPAEIVLRGIEIGAASNDATELSPPVAEAVERLVGHVKKAARRRVAAASG